MVAEVALHFNISKPKAFVNGDNRNKLLRKNSKCFQVLSAILTKKKKIKKIKSE